MLAGSYFLTTELTHFRLLLVAGRLGWRWKLLPRPNRVEIAVEDQPPIVKSAASHWASSVLMRDRPWIGRLIARLARRHDKLYWVSMLIASERWQEIGGLTNGHYSKCWLAAAMTGQRFSMLMSCKWFEMKEKKKERNQRWIRKAESSSLEMLARPSNRFLGSAFNTRLQTSTWKRIFTVESRKKSEITASGIDFVSERGKNRLRRLKIAARQTSQLA